MDKKTVHHKKEKVILHMDGDAFFVGVEVAKNPKLRGLPVVTGEERGIVSALSYEAKALGVVRGMPIFKLRRQFPKIIVLPGDYASYARYSSMMFDVVRRYADDVEEYSIDECFADMTGLDRTQKMPIREMALRIQHEVSEELGLSVTIGLAPTKVLAKVASKRIKPHGFTEITEASVESILADTPITTIWGIGPRVATALHGYGIRTARDYISQDVSWVKRHFAKPQEAIWHELRGTSVNAVDATGKSALGSLQRTRTFSSATTNPEFLLNQLEKHIEDACTKVRYHHLVPRKLMLYLRTQNFTSVAHIVLLPEPTASPSMLIEQLQKNFQHVYKRGVLYRSAGITLLELISTEHIQGNLFALPTDATNKFATLHAHIDALEEKHGKRMVHLASTHGIRRSTTKKGTDFEEMERNLLFL